MCSLRTVAAVLALFLTADLVQCQRYTIPEAELELLSPKGLKISIPDDDPKRTHVFFDININKEFSIPSTGHSANGMMERKDGRWTNIIPEFKVKQGDTIYYWIQVIILNTELLPERHYFGYFSDLDRSYRVTEPNPHGGSLLFPVPPSSESSSTRKDWGKSVSKNKGLLKTIFRGLNL